MNQPTIPSQQENPNGLHQRYSVKKADGTPTDPNAVYFVLRLDNFGHDPQHVRACRKAARTFAEFAPQHMRKVADELHTLLDRLEGKRVQEDQ